eukprot:CAMPEP_0185813294 /NCGR_PEP_ID=MMETSP1322-20130828/11211_1 /TAXON_ID=265543 /ORGANISM="Minutocellus polymorphus, Strain RCC2270" /LENGTH=357 /DNA_ID=CAMNT_0028509947 /DNA_START=71 /DNA_END=1144 /DNA_ORIENTATION=+
MSAAAKATLYDMPVSNNGARSRIIIYKKKISSEVDIVSPMELGGLKSPEYLKLNPQGKMPLLTVEGSSFAIPESDTICRYLLSTYADVGPSFLPNDAKSNLIARLHDMYLTTIQGCLYKATPPFGIYGTRKDALDEFRKQMKVIDDLIDADRDGIYLCGSEVSLADATLFPTMTFARHMLPKFGIPETDALPPKIKSWYSQLLAGDDVFNKVHDEVLGALQGWDEKGRWDTIPLAGLRDEDPETIFDKIIAKEIPASVVYEDRAVLAFKDINPAAPAHVLVIPKERNGLSGLRKASPDHVEILGKLLVAAGEISKDESLGFKDGARIVINDGPDGGQEVPHLHVHVLGGRSLTWPPG